MFLVKFGNKTYRCFPPPMLLEKAAFDQKHFSKKVAFEIYQTISYLLFSKKPLLSVAAISNGP